MNIFFYIAFGYITLFGCLSFFLNKERIPRICKILMIAAILAAVFILIKYDLIEKKERAYEEFIASIERKNILTELQKLQEKDKRGELTTADYDRYIALYLENINFNLRQLKRKNNRAEWITTYYSEVSKIPEYFDVSEWQESETILYNSIVDEIRGDFVSRNLTDNPMEKELLNIFAKERNKLRKAKERESNK